MKFRNQLLLFLSITFISACQSINNLLDSNNPRKNYIEQFEKSELAKKDIFKKWLNNWNQAKLQPQIVELPYLEEGVFFIADAKAYGYQFSLKEGEKLIIELNSKTTVFAELYNIANSNNSLASLNSENANMQYSVKNSGTYLLILQGDILDGGKFELKIQTTNSLNFPVSGANYKDVGSFWGAARDGGKRSHKGVDIFAKRGTPVVAVSGGVARAKQNNLGGKVVWLYNAGEGKSYYYAHLDSQLVKGNLVKVGDTLGLVGNTGNAKYTPPHLHFGIYGGSGAVDPFPFIDDKKKTFKTVKTDSAVIGNYFTITSATANIRNQPNSKNNTPITSLPKNSTVQVISATDDWQKIRYDGNKIGFIYSSLLKPIESKQTRLLGKYIISDEFELQASDTVEINKKMNVFQLADNKLIDANTNRFSFEKLE